MRLTLFLLILMSTVVNASVDTTLTSTTFLYGTMSNGRYKVLVNEDFVDRYDTTASTVTLTYNNFGDFSSLPNGKVQIDMSHSTTSFVYKCNAASVPIPVKAIGAKNYNPAITTSVTLSRILHATQDATTGLTTFYILGGKTPFDIYTTTSSITSLIPKSQGVTASGSGWSLTGNAGTNPVTDFVGTTDSSGLAIQPHTLNKGATRIGDINGEDRGNMLYIDSNLFFVGDYNAIINADGIGYNLDNSDASINFSHNIQISAADMLQLQPSGSKSIFGSGGVTKTPAFFNVYGKISPTSTDTIAYIANSAESGFLAIHDAPFSLQYIDGTQGAGKVLTSDSNGLASWQNPSYSVNAILQDTMGGLRTHNLLADRYNVLYDTSAFVSTDTLVFPSSPTDRQVLELKVLVNTMTGLYIISPDAYIMSPDANTGSSPTAPANFSNYAISKFSYVKWQYDSQANTWY